MTASEQRKLRSACAHLTLAANAKRKGDVTHAVKSALLELAPMAYMDKYRGK